jgi:hypothetical protein
MSTEENKALARRELEEIFNAKGNLDAAEEIYTPNYISHQPAGDEDLRGPEAMKQFAAGLRRAFPDLEITIAYCVGGEFSEVGSPLLEIFYPSKNGS